MSTEIIGYLAMFVITVALLPQIIKSWRTKSTTDISLSWNLTYLLGLILWLIYGITLGSLPLIISASLEALMTISLLVLKIRFK